jgi:thiosulfate/3-mercaptopyruvate sulfurtransferase
MRAARDAWILQYLGHPRVRLLHGGLTAWQAAGCKLTSEPADDWTVGLRVRERADMVIGYEEIAGSLGRPGITLLDVRDADEHAGRDKTPCCARRGIIPGAVWIEWTRFLEGGRFRSPEAIRGLLRESGVDPESELVPYCHRGARSANTYYALKQAGLPKVRNYIGSWHEWSARSELPIEQP